MTGGSTAALPDGRPPVESAPVAKRKRKFIQGAVKHPGSLNREVGGPASERLAKVRYLAEHGTPEQQRRARFYLGVLRPLNKRKAARG